MLSLISFKSHEIPRSSWLAVKVPFLKLTTISSIVDVANIDTEHCLSVTVTESGDRAGERLNSLC